VKKYLYIPSGGAAAVTVTDTWVKAKLAKFPAYAEHAQKVLDLEVDASVTFPSGALYKRLADDSDAISAIICHRGRARKLCTFPRCKSRVAVACDFPIGSTIGSRQLTCDRGRCREHAVSVGPDLDYCIEHPRDRSTRK
jgi:hypothetical protein